MLGVLHPCKEWYSFALVGVVLSICQTEAPLHPYLLLAQVFRRLLLLCVLWLAVGSCIHVLKSRLWRRQKQVSSSLLEENYTSQRLRLIGFSLCLLLLPFLSRESRSWSSHRRLWLKTGITSTHGQAFISVYLYLSFHSLLTESLQKKDKVCPKDYFLSIVYSVFSPINLLGFIRSTLGSEGKLQIKYCK